MAVYICLRLSLKMTAVFTVTDILHCQKSSQRKYICLSSDTNKLVKIGAIYSILSKQYSQNILREISRKTDQEKYLIS
jgi:hypothetical protein